MKRAGTDPRLPGLAQRAKRIIGRKVVMACAFCGTHLSWPVDFVSRTYAQCWACWLAEDRPRAAAVRKAFARIPTPLASDDSDGTT